MSEQTTNAASDALAGIPGLGPARRAMLVAAGIVSRADLRATTVEQLVSVTGMPRVQAERALSALHATQEASANPAPPAADEALPDASGDLPVPQTAAPTSPEPEPPFEEARFLLAAQTALSDATRTLGKKGGLTKSLERLSVVLERLSGPFSSLGPKRRARLADRLHRLVTRLEKVAARPTELLKPTRARRLRERLKNERQILAALLGKQKAKRKQ